MSDQEILEKAIQKAIDGGYRYDEPTTDFSVWQTGKEPIWLIEIGGWPEVNVEAIIFNHDFAKALWGEKLGYSFEEGQIEERMIPDRDSYDRGETWRDEYQHYHYYWVPAWFYHLQQMVTADDPIKYLRENVEYTPKR